MTPEEIKQKARIIKQAFNDDEGLNLLVHAARCVDELESSALRLAAIEAAGDEEVDRACDGLMKSYRSLDDSLFHRSMNALDDIAKSRNATIADLRAKLGEAEAELKRRGDQIGWSADGVLMMDCINVAMYCPHCGEKVDGDSFTAYCWNCTNPDDGCWPHKSPRPLSWESCNAKKPESEVQGG